MSELKKVIDDIGASFEEFKVQHEKELAELKKNGTADPLLTAQVDKINEKLGELTKLKSRLDDVEAASNRPGAGGTGEDNKFTAEHKKAFDAFFRKGREAGLSDLEVQAALTTQSDPEGGYVVPEEIDTEISRVLGETTAMRSLARVRPVGSATFKKIVNVGGTSSGWVGEEEARTETTTPSLKELEFPVMELYAEPRATQAMLDDAFFNTESWLADEVSMEFSEAEGTAFISGNGVKKPRGILSYTNVLNASYAWGNIGYVASGAAADFAATNPSDQLIDLQHALKRGYRNGAAWLMGDGTFAKIRKFKDGNGQYLWVPGLTSGEPTTLLGKRLEIDDNMPVVAANALAIAYGDFLRAYVITDRFGTRVLRDPYTSKPYVKFYTTKRVGGGIQNYEAIKLMKIEA